MPLRAMASLRMRCALFISHPTHALSADSLSAPVVCVQGEREPMRSKTEGLIEIFKQAERTGMEQVWRDGGGAPVQVCACAHQPTGLTARRLDRAFIKALFNDPGRLPGVLSELDTVPTSSLTGYAASDNALRVWARLFGQAVGGPRHGRRTRVFIAHVRLWGTRGPVRHSDKCRRS